MSWLTKYQVSKEWISKNWIVSIFGAVIIGFVVFGFLVTGIFYRPSESAAAYGDSFGFVNSLFSALAFAGVVVALILQAYERRYAIEFNKELAKQHKELVNQQYITSLASAAQSFEDIEVLEPKLQLEDTTHAMLKFVKAKFIIREVLLSSALSGDVSTSKDQLVDQALSDATIRFEWFQKGFSRFHVALKLLDNCRDKKCIENSLSELANYLAIYHRDANERYEKLGTNKRDEGNHLASAFLAQAAIRVFDIEVDNNFKSYWDSDLEKPKLVSDSLPGLKREARLILNEGFKRLRQIID